MRFGVHAAILVAGALLVAMAALPHGSRSATPAQAPLSPALRSVMAASAADAHVAFVAVLREQADPVRLRVEADRLRLEGRRDEARARTLQALRGVAERTQGPVLSLLRAEQRRGRASAVRALWVANVVAGRATPAVLTALAALPAVDRVFWNPAARVPEQTDEIVPPHGLRAVAPRPGGRDSTVGWNLVRVGAPLAWASGFTGDGVVVAVLDTGVDYTHPDLADHIWVNADEIPRNALDDDFNGFVDDTLGWDFVNGDNDPMGDGSTDHGTRAAGLVAGDGTQGVATGVAPDARIMPVKASGGPWSSLFAGMQYALDNGADVISMSVSQKWRFDPKPDYTLWRQITDNVLAAGVCHANSIGNEGDNLETDPVPFNVAAPGGSPAPWVATEQYVVGGVSSVTGVGAIDSVGYLTDFSSRGPSAWEDIAARWPEYPYSVPAEYQDYPYSNGDRGLIKPDLIAPGDEVLSTRQGGGYLSFTGTSAACPHVAGAMAILLEAHPDLTPAQVAMVLQRSATDWGVRGKDDDYGAGLLRIPSALQLAGNLSSYCGLSGAVRDAVTGDSLSGALVNWLEGWRSDSTNARGIYQLAPLAGTVSLLVRCFGYVPDTLTLSLAPGDTLDLPIDLQPWPRGALQGVVRDAVSGLPIEGAVVALPGTPVASATTGPDGAYLFASFLADTTLPVRAAVFGYARAESAAAVPADSTRQLDFALAPGYADDFEVNLGWSGGVPGDDATCGTWLRADPVGIDFNGVMIQPEYDHTAGAGRTCFLTGNGVPGCGPFQNDVDGGTTTLLSPRFDATGYFTPTLSLWWWFSNDASVYQDDTLRIELSLDDGESWAPVLVTGEPNHAWQELVVDLEAAPGVSDRMRLRVRASDEFHDSSVEVAVDDFWMGTPEWAGLDETRIPRLLLHGPRPNPSGGATTFALTLSRDVPVRLGVYDLNGRCVRVLAAERLAPGTHTLSWNGRDAAGRGCPTGIYFARLEAGDERMTRRVVRVR